MNSAPNPPNVISLTFDLEWAPDPVLKDVLSILRDHDIKSTMFSTHKDGIKMQGHERGLHPNFLREDSSESETLSEIKNIFPQSKGIRSHSLYIHSPLRELYASKGIEYESNYMMFRVEKLRPFHMASGTIQFPIYFMDDNWLRRRKGNRIPDMEKLLQTKGMKVFDFHPPHICFNTPSMEFYNKNKEQFWDPPSDLRKLRSNRKGVRDLFLNLLEHINQKELKTCTLGELNQKYQKYDSLNI